MPLIKYYFKIRKILFIKTVIFNPFYIFRDNAKKKQHEITLYDTLNIINNYYLKGTFL